MKKLFIFFGAAGSGKSTLAYEFSKYINATFYDGDDSYTLKMRRKAKKSKEKVMEKLYQKLLDIVDHKYKEVDYFCLTHSFTENKWKEMFINKYKDKVVFIFIKPNKEKHSDRLFKREKSDPANLNRDESELKKVLTSYIDKSNVRREYPESYVTIYNDYDRATVAKMNTKLKKFL